MPRFEGVLPSQRVTAQSLLPGRPVAGADEAASAAGSLLAALHAAELDSARLNAVAPPERQLAAAAASARLVVAVAPPLGRRVKNLLRELERATPEAGELVPAHGDFNARQLLLVGGELALTDFDEFCLAPPALDLATYIAYVVRGAPAHLVTAEGVLEALLDGYGSRPRAMSWYLATMLLRRAPRPFRYFEPEWPDGVEAMVDAAEDALSW